MKTLLIAFTISLMTGSSFAQIELHTTAFWNNYSSLNPAMCGLEYKHQASTSYQDRIDGTDSYLRSFFANYNTKFRQHTGLGINSRLHTNYFTSMSRVVLNYNYHFTFRENHTLSFGAGIGFDHYSLRHDWYDETYTGVTAKTDLDFTAGVAYLFKKLTLGVGVSRIASTSIRIKSNQNNPYIHLWREQFSFHGAYPINLSQNLVLKPQIFIQTSVGYHSVHLNLLLTVKKKYWLGFTYEGSSSFSVTSGYDIKEKYRIGYAYQQYFSKLNNNFQSSCHEFTLGFLLR